MEAEKRPVTVTESESLKRLDAEIEKQLTKILPKQARFCFAVAAGEKRDKAYLMAGYKNSWPREAANRLINKPHMRDTIKLLQKRYALENGVGLSWKRQRIIDAINLAEETKQSNAMISGVRLLAEIDQDIGGLTTAGGIEITIVTGVDRGIDHGVTIDNE